MPNLSAPTVHVEIETHPAGGHVARLILDDERRLNCLSGALLTGLAEAAGRLADDDDLRVVVLTGAGSRAFAGGADLKELGAVRTPGEAKAFITKVHQACAALRALPVPVIARIFGHCLGAGLEIAASCDMRVSADNGVFGMPEVKIGLPSVVEAALLPRLIGWGRTAEMLYGGDNIDAATAYEWGLVERVTPLADLDAAIDALVGRMAANAPLAMRNQKRLMNKWERLALDEAVEAGIPALAEAFATDEPRQRIADLLATLGKQR